MKTTGIKTAMVRLFGKKPSPPRAWEFDQRDIPKILRLTDNLKRHPGQEATWRLWQAVYEIHPDLRGRNDIALLFREGGVPYVGEIS